MNILTATDALPIPLLIPSKLLISSTLYSSASPAQSPLPSISLTATTRRATPSNRAVLVNLTHLLQTPPRQLQGIINHRLGHTQRDPTTIGAGAIGLLIAAVGRAVGLAAVSSRFRRAGRGGRRGAAVGGRGGCGEGFGVGAHVGEDAGQEVRVGGDLAAAEEGEGVRADGRGPVGGVGVEGVEEVF